jgi:hypothetical protein
LPIANRAIHRAIADRGIAHWDLAIAIAQIFECANAAFGNRHNESLNQQLAIGNGRRPQTTGTSSGNT